MIERREREREREREKSDLQKKSVLPTSLGKGSGRRGGGRGAARTRREVGYTDFF